MSRCEPRRLAAYAAPVAVFVIAIAACRSGGPAAPGATGALDAARVVAVGDGYLAGVTNGALFASAQQFSVAALFVGAVAPSSDFRQPLVSDPGIATDDVARGRFTLVSLKPLELARESRGQPLEPELGRPYDNLAVPNAFLVEALVAQATPSSIFGNPFYDVVLRGRGTFSQQVAERDATMVLLWLGSQDVLAYVLAGGDPALAPGLPTPSASFTSIYEDLLDELSATTDQIVLFNIPDPTRLPLLFAVPNVVLDSVTGDTVLVTVSEPVFDPDTGEQIGSIQVQRPVPLIGPGGPLDDTERVSLGAIPYLEQGIGVPVVLGGTGAPLPDSAVLDAGEIATIQGAVAAYNAEIARIAAERDLAVVDVHGLVEAMAAGGVPSDGILLTTDWLYGQAFSLDGYSFTPKGYGAVTNLLIDAVNARYGGNLPHVRTAELPGIPLFGF